MGQQENLLEVRDGSFMLRMAEVLASLGAQRNSESIIVSLP